MRIALVDPSIFSGPYDEHLCHGLTCVGHSVRLYTRPVRSSDQWFTDSYERVPLFYRRSESWFSGFPRLRSLAKGVEHAFDLKAFRRSLEEYDPEVVHFQWIPAPFLDRRVVEGLAARRKVVLTVHDTIAFQGSPTSSLQTVGLADALGAFHRLIVHTAQSARTLESQGFPGEMIRIVPHGVLYAAGPESPDPFPTQRPDRKNKNILFFGNVKPYKGLDILFQAYRQALQRTPEPGSLIVAGTVLGDEKAWVDLTKKLDIAHRVDLRFGHVPDSKLPQLFSEASILAFPYRHIDASGALMLVLPLGRAIIASDVGLFSEIFRSGENAYLVPPEDPRALGEGLTALAADPELRDRLSRSSAALAGSSLDWGTIATKTIQVYEEIPPPSQA